MILLPYIAAAKPPSAFYSADTPKLRQETFVLSECSVFGRECEWSGEGRRKSERGKAAADGRDGRRDGRREGVGDQSRRGSFVDKRPGCLSPSPSLSPLCACIDRDRARMPLLLQRNEEQRRKKRERNVGRTDGRTRTADGGRRAGGKTAHFLPLQCFLNMQMSDRQLATDRMQLFL